MFPPVPVHRRRGNCGFWFSQKPGLYAGIVLIERITAAPVCNLSGAILLHDGF
jgi:hypothetical protein